MLLLFVYNFIILGTFLLKDCIFAEHLLTVTYEHGALRKEVVIAPVVEWFISGKYYW